MLRSAFATPISLVTLLVGLLAGPTTSTLAADSSLVYTPVQPCRIFDTRNTGGPIAAGTSEDFYVYGDAATMFAQGGNPAGCPAPQGEPIAVHLNITVVPLGNGHIRVYPKGTALPNASTVNYTAGTNIANAVTLKTTFDPADLDISVYSSNTANVLADVQGYYYPKLKNVITVSAQYADFTNPIDAINSIPTTGPDAPSATNPYVIQIGPGTYDLGSNQLIMREWVDIKGTGSREATVLTGAVSSASYFATSALVVGANNAELTDLTIINTGGSTYSVAIYNNGTSPKIRRIKTRASGATQNRSIINEFDANPSMSNINAKASGGTNAYGIFNNVSSPTMKEVTAVATDGTSINYAIYNSTSSPSMSNIIAMASSASGSVCMGVYNSTSSPLMNNVNATASGCMDNRGVRNYYSSSPIMTNVIASASGGTYNRGVLNEVSATVTIRSSTLEGTTYSVFTDATSTAKISSSTLIGGAGGTTANNCVYVADENNNALDANCLPIP